MNRLDSHDIEAAIMKCPRCQQKLEKTAIDKLILDVCPECEGSFFDFGELDQVFAMSENQIRKSGLGMILVEDMTLALDLEEPVNCPRCENEMQRGRYLKECPVIIDKCPEHGVWLDDGELGQLMDFLANTIGAKKGEDDSLKARIRRAPDALMSTIFRIFGLD